MLTKREEIIFGSTNFSAINERLKRQVLVILIKSKILTARYSSFENTKFPYQKMNETLRCRGKAQMSHMCVEMPGMC